MENELLFCKGGGCTAKLGPGALKHVLDKLPKNFDPNLLVGFDSSDDAAVYQLTEDIAMVQTLDFFPPMVEDPYLFGQIAATNALSDVYAMGGDVKSALNIVCFPEKMDLNILGQILAGGNDKVTEAGGILAGGHSINDTDVKYGLSVTGTIHPNKIYRNHGCKISDKLILTKPLGVGIIVTANRVGEASAVAMEKAITSMVTLNKYASEIMRKYQVHAVTDVTGFGFLGHLHEMLQQGCSAVIDSKSIPYIEEAYSYANEFFITAAGQRNRNHVEAFTEFQNVDFAMEEILLDPQTSGGLLISVSDKDGAKLLDELKELGMPCNIVGEIVVPGEKEIIIL
jgi:selenide,water dikinase